MPMILYTSSGAFMKAQKKLMMMSSKSIVNALNKYGEQGVAALKAATPIETSASANAWYSKVATGGKMYRLSWHNDNLTDDGTPVVILIQFGHGTGTGGYVAGEDFINPAIKPIFDKIVAEIRREVKK